MHWSGPQTLVEIVIFCVFVLKIIVTIVWNTGGTGDINLTCQDILYTYITPNYKD